MGNLDLRLKCWHETTFKYGEAPAPVFPQNAGSWEKVTMKKSLDIQSFYSLWSFIGCSSSASFCGWGGARWAEIRCEVGWGQLKGWVSSSWYCSPVARERAMCPDVCFMCRAALMALFREPSRRGWLAVDRERLILLLTSSSPLTPDAVPVPLLGDIWRGTEYNLKRGWVGHNYTICNYNLLLHVSLPPNSLSFSITLSMNGKMLQKYTYSKGTLCNV